MSSELSRYSDLRIPENIMRTFLYRDLLAYVANHANAVIEKEIFHDETLRADLIAHRIYQEKVLRWAVCLCVGVDDESTPIPVGDVFRFPPAVFIRERIRHYENNGGI